MKIGEPCYAVVDGEGAVSATCESEREANEVADAFADNRLTRRVIACVFLPTSEVARLRKCEAENVKLRELLLKAGHIIDQIAIQTSSVPMFLGILNEISAASLTPSGDGETEKSE